MSNPDLDQIDRDAFDEMQRERDRLREPVRAGRARPSHATAALPPGAASRPAPFRAFQARMQDALTHAFTDEPTQPGMDTAEGIVAAICPACARSVYVLADSDSERVDCWWCKAQLLTRRTASGVELDHVRLTRGAP